MKNKSLKMIHSVLIVIFLLFSMERGRKVQPISKSPSLELSVLRFNSDRTLLPPSSETQWSWWNTSFNISDSDSPIMILIEGVGGGGEAEEEEEEVQVAAVDNITLTFCLPCDFGLLPQSGNLILSAPSFVNMTLGRVTNFSLSVSSPLCPSLPLVINIDAGKLYIFLLKTV